MRAELQGERDTIGVLVLDTGAGFLGLEGRVAERLGLVDEFHASPTLELAPRPLKRLRLGEFSAEQVAPILLLDLGVVRRVSGRSVLGLLGQRIFTGRGLWIDYETPEVVVFPNPPTSTPAPTPDPGDRQTADAAVDPTSSELLTSSRTIFGNLLSRSAVAVPFRLLGDGKMIIRARVGQSSSTRSDAPWLNLVLDTGATQCVLFEPAFSQTVPAARAWPSVDGLVAPTLLGNLDARLTIAPSTTLESVSAKGHRASTRTNVEFALVQSELAATLAAAIGESVHGLLGYSFLRNYRLGIDFTRSLLWLDPTDHSTARLNEHSHVGIQLETIEDEIRVSAVAQGSPAAVAGIHAGESLTSVDERTVRGQDVIEVGRWLQGKPGSSVRLTLEGHSGKRVVTLVRRRLL